MADWVVCPVVTVTRRGRDSREPAIAPYAHGSVLVGTKTACVMKVIEWLDKATALAIANVLLLDTDQLDVALTSQRANQVSNFLSQRTDLAITVSAGDTVRVVLQRIAASLGHTNTFDPARL